MTSGFLYTGDVMRSIRAFYYEGRYFIYPPFDLVEGASIELTELRRQVCVGTYFPESDCRKVTITLERVHRTYPFQAFLVPANIYQEMIRDAQREAQEEGALQEGLYSPYEPAFAVEDFWFGFIKIADELRACIDRGELLQGVAMLSGLLTEVEMQEYVFPALSRYVYRDPRGETTTRYVLMLTAGGIPGAELMTSYFMRRMPTFLTSEWDIYPYAVRGFYTQLPLFTGCDPEADPPLLQVVYLEQQDIFAVRMFVQWPDEEVPANVFCANYMYLCQIIGEDRLRGAVLEMMPFPKSEMVFEGDCVTPQEFSEMIDDQIRNRERLAYPRCGLRELDMEGMQEKRNVSHLTTYCEQLSFDFILGFEGPSLYLWDGEISLGTLFVPGDRLTKDDDLEYISGVIGQALYDSYWAEPIDLCTGPDGVYFDFIVLHKENVRQELSARAPVFAAFDAVYTERLGGEIDSRPVDFDMRLSG